MFENALQPLTTVIRYLIPIIAVIIVLEVVRILLRNRRKPAPMAYFELDSGDLIDILFYENSIGRSKVNDIILLDPSASRFHAVLALRGGGWILTDTDSKSGVLLNGRKVDKSAAVQQGDVITMGNTALTFLDKLR